jgi:hypothetical protein
MRFGCPSWTLIEPCALRRSLILGESWKMFGRCSWPHSDLTASYAWVEVRLQNHAAKGITDKDFDLAKKIEDVVLWQPGKEGGPLEGTPTDQRFAYIDYKKS